MSPLETEENLSREFSGPPDLSTLDRREFFRYLGLFSSMTLLSHCSRKAEKLIPFVNEEKAFAVHNYEYYASAFPSRGFAQGVLVKSYQGRPVKIEGNPEHPWSFGATSAGAQAALYELYHPGRITAPVIRGKKARLEDVRGLLNTFRPQKQDGSDLAFLVPALHSPTVHHLLSEIRKKWPRSSVVSVSPWAAEDFTTYDLESADTILSFDEDLFSGRPDYLSLSRKFMARRKSAIDKNSAAELNRLMVCASTPTLAGAKADRHFLLPRSEVWNWAVDLLDALEGRKTGNQEIKKYLSALKSSGLVVIDRKLHPDAGALEEAINRHLGKSGKTWKTELPDNISIEELQTKMKAGNIHTAFILEPEFTVSPDWQMSLQNVPEKMSLSLFPNVTTSKSTTVIPASHWLEAWGDLSTADGTVTIQQPLIEPLYPSLGLVSFLSLLLGEKRGEHDILEEVWQERTAWNQALKKGIIHTEGTLLTVGVKKAFSRLPGPRWEILVTPDPYLGYGEHAENPVLQELPRPFTRITWGNVFILSENEAKKLNVTDEEKIRIKTDKGDLEGPVLVSPLVPDRMIVTSDGFGKQNGTEISKGHGFSASGFSGAKVLSVKKIRGRKKLARVQHTMHMDGHPPVKTAALPLSNPANHHETPMSFYPDHPIPSQEKGPQWGMTIDLTACIGCEACVAACQTENNVPFVGEDQVRKHRHMHWLRIDNYIEEKAVFFQPVPCMHCEKAPCEVVCPVNATVHGNGGLNEMVYNRCVGTRYCSNNCPYKVRRFNFKAYSVLPEPWNFGFNPEVSVRDRGVMEKCTFCVQRIKHGERNTEVVKTACQAVCPTEAIAFGDLRNETSAVAQNKKSPRNYDLLEEEGTRPRTSYLKVIRGPA